MLIIPAIDIMGSKVVRLHRGDFDKASIYELSPLAYAKEWAAQGASWIHIVDLDGAKTGEPKNFSTIKEILTAVAVKFEIGGGVRSLETMKKYLEAGAERIVLSTKVVEDTSFLLTHGIKDTLNRVAVSLDIKHMESADVVTTATAGWLQSGDLLIDIPSFMQTVTQAGVRCVNFSDITKDGTLVGPDVKKISYFLKVAQASAAGPLFLTYAGGISSLEDLKHLNSLSSQGLGGIIVGKALYENKFSLKDAMDAVS